MSNRRLLERMWNAFREGDLDTYEGCYADDVVVRYPQSGEVIRGRDNYMATIRNDPTALPSGTEGEIRGQQDVITRDWSMPVMFRSMTIQADGDTLVGNAILEYQNGDVYHSVSVFEISRGKVKRETTWYAVPFEAPSWRSQWVELEGG